MTTNKAPELVYSTDEENFSHDFCGMLDSLRTEFDDGDLVGKTYWVGEKVEHPASYYFKGAADDVVQRACDDAYQENEHAEDFTSDVTKEALAELQTFINTWADKHVGVTFWTARNVREMKVTPEDLA